MEVRRSRAASSRWARGTALLAALVAGVVLSAGSASALSVTVTYQLSANPTHQITTLLGGQPITGLTATVVAPLPTLNASTLTGNASLMSLRLTNSLGTFALKGLPKPGSPCGANGCTWLLTGTVPPDKLTSPTNIGTATKLMTKLNVNFATGKLAFTARQQKGCLYTGCSGAGFTHFTQVQGTEVLRTAVPEPGTPRLLLVSVAVLLGAYLADRAWRRRTSRETTS